MVGNARRRMVDRFPNELGPDSRALQLIFLKLHPA